VPPEDVSRSAQVGFDQHLVKPIDLGAIGQLPRCAESRSTGGGAPSCPAVQVRRTPTKIARETDLQRSAHPRSIVLLRARWPLTDVWGPSGTVSRGSIASMSRSPPIASDPSPSGATRPRATT
jgi:hypothetical protein